MTCRARAASAHPERQLRRRPTVKGLHQCRSRRLGTDVSPVEPLPGLCCRAGFQAYEVAKRERLPVPYLGLIVLVVMIAALIDIIGSEVGVRGLPQWGWLLLVIVLPLVGSIVWFVAGRPLPGSGRYSQRSGSGRATALGFPEYDEPGRFEPQDPVADAEFLRQVRARAEEQRRRGELERRRQRDGDTSE